jgi:Cdc6-like AAA superfamily ATPase
MIRDARVLQDNHLPREIVHRHEEMNRLAAALEPVDAAGRATRAHRGCRAAVPDRPRRAPRLTAAQQEHVAFDSYSRAELVAILERGAERDDAGDVRSGHPAGTAVPPAASTVSV